MDKGEPARSSWMSTKMGEGSGGGEHSGDPSGRVWDTVLEVEPARTL